MRVLLILTFFVAASCQCGDVSTRDAGGGGPGLPDGGTVDAGSVDGGAVRDGGSGTDAGLSADGGIICDGLTADACRMTPGCRADFCTGCTCGSNYQGCRPFQSHPPICPLTPCPEPSCCSSNADCLGNTFCVSPEAPPSCGTCNNTPSTCTTDAECAPSICEPRPCACADEHACVPGCSDTNPCHSGLACNPTTRRCESVACTTDAQCASTFTCGTSGLCVRRTCTDDTQCGLGACVNGECFDSRGHCQDSVR